MADTHENDSEKVWKLVKKVRIAMVVTWKGDEFDGRPLYAYPEPDAGRILLMTDSAHVLHEVDGDSRVMLTFADTGGNDFVAVDGDAVVRNDRAKIKELWTPWAEAFWKSPDDPAIRIIEVTPHHARYWDAPNKIATTIAMLAGVITGKQPKLGESGDVRMS